MDLKDFSNNQNEQDTEIKVFISWSERDMPTTDSDVVDLIFTM